MRETSLRVALSQWTEAKVCGQLDATKDKQPFPGVAWLSHHNGLQAQLIPSDNIASERGGQEMALALGAEEGVQRTPQVEGNTQEVSSVLPDPLLSSRGHSLDPRKPWHPCDLLPL